MAKIGIDFHGVIDLYPDIFRSVCSTLIAHKNEIHVITGQQWEKVEPKVKKLDIPYTHHFSIVDYHLAQRTAMWMDDKKTYWMDEVVWRKSKGEYIAREGIDVHFDDCAVFAEYIPSNCTFVLVPKKNFEAFW